jgi:hypothetical protein
MLSMIWRAIQTANSKSARKKKKAAENAERAAVPSKVNFLARIIHDGMSLGR